MDDRLIWCIGRMKNYLKANMSSTLLCFLFYPRCQISWNERFHLVSAKVVLDGNQQGLSDSSFLWTVNDDVMAHECNSGTDFPICWARGFWPIEKNRNIQIYILALQKMQVKYCSVTFDSASIILYVCSLHSQLLILFSQNVWRYLRDHPCDWVPVRRDHPSDCVPIRRDHPSHWVAVGRDHCFDQWWF